MNLTLLTKALQHYALSADCNESDRKCVFDMIGECHEQLERNLHTLIKNDNAYLISDDTLAKMFHQTTYGLYGKLAKDFKGKAPFSMYDHVVRTECEFVEMTTRMMMLGYDLISDVWHCVEDDGLTTV